MKNTDFLRIRVKALASTGLSPYEIEGRLSIPHYTIHINFHNALMDGYEKAERKAQAELYRLKQQHKREMEKLNKAEMSEEEKRQLRNALERDYYHLNKEEIKKRRNSKNLEERIRRKSRRSDES